MPAPESLLPLGLRLRGRRVVVVGGGTVALRRVGGLLAAHADVALVSPALVVALQDLAERGQVQWRQRPYAEGDLDGAWLAMACTGDAQVNAAVVAEAEARHLFCLRADDAMGASAWMPATGRTGPATVSVHGGRDPRRAAALRDAAVSAVASALRTELPGRSRPAAGDGAGGVGGVGEPGEPGDHGDTGQLGGQLGRTGETGDVGEINAAGTTGREPPGRVVLVGGGPGDPELLTLKGFQALAEADVVVVDRLAPLAALDGLREGVEIVDVSKIPRGRFTPQEQINQVLVDRAREGRTVVRLKGGDPFVFGRGMEEFEACVAAGLPVQVVPGVSSAIAAPELAGIPLTHRGLSQGFTVVSGHAAPDDPRSTVDWAAVARSGLTIVVLMGVETLASIVQAVEAAGLDPATPLAAVMDAGMPTQQVVRTTLAQILAAGVPPGLRAPAVVVIGAVAAFAAG